METHNRNKILIFLFLFTTFTLIFVVGQDTTGFFHCSDAYCTEVTRLKPCPAKRNCSTTGFRTFIDPSECNCCDYCFDYLKENATCSPSSPQKPIEMCGPYLECQKAEKETEPATCQLIVSGPKDKPIPDPNFCMARLKSYTDAKEDGSLGIVQFLPECDAGGNYSPRQCIPGSLCYCSNSQGKRIFGQALPGERQDCACARDVARLQEFGFQGRMPHCLSNGDYDELQCVVRSCYCRSYPNEIYPPQNMTSLKCYNKSIHVYDTQTPLYYMRTCELRKAEAEIDIAEAAIKGTLMVISDTPSCDPDGNFSPIQLKFDRQFCADPINGEMLEGFQVAKFSREADAMNCYCARARYLMRNSATGKPQCCKNGNYRTLQHIGSTWYCVDEYGRQNVTGFPVEVHEDNIEQLPCFSKNDPDLPVSEMGCTF